MIQALRQCFIDDRGQSTVEAAFTLPIVMLLVLLLVQPGIILYDRMVMQGAAAEGCRLLAMATSGDAETCEEYILRRLGSVPQQSLFHVHEGTCSWEVELSGDSGSGSVSVRISHEVKPIPLIGSLASLAGLTNEAGNLTVEVESSLPTQPSWAGGAAG